MLVNVSVERVVDILDASGGWSKTQRKVGVDRATVLKRFQRGALVRNERGVEYYVTAEHGVFSRLLPGAP
jgi:hypothetical protein